MPIPLANNFEKNIQTPRVAQARALDLSRDAQTSIAMAEDLGRKVNQAVGGSMAAVSQIVIDQKNAHDLLNANNAFNEYNKKIDDLNRRLESTNGADTIAFRQEYTKLATEYHDKVVGDIGGIRNEKIREDLRAKINSINLRNQEFSFKYFDKEQRSLEKQANEEAMDFDIKNAVPKYVNGASSYNDNLTTNLFAKISSRIKSEMSSEGFHEVDEKTVKDGKEINEGIKAMRNNRIARKMQTALDIIAEHLIANNVSDTEEWHETADAIQLIEHAMKRKMIDSEWALKKLNEYEKRALGVELMRHPEKYWDQSTGEYQRKEVMKHVKYLTPDDIERTGKSVSSTADSNPTAIAELGGVLPNLIDVIAKEDEAFRHMHGIYTNTEREGYLKVYGEKEKEEIEEQWLQARNKTSPAELIERLITMQEQRHQRIVVVPGLTNPIRVSKDLRVQNTDLSKEKIKEIEDMIQAGQLSVYQPYNHNSEFEKIYKDFEEMAELMLEKKAVEGTNRVVNKQSIWFGLGGRYNYDVRSAYYQMLWSAFKTIADMTHEGVPDTLYHMNTQALIKAAREGDKYIRNGGFVLSDTSYGNNVLRDNNGNPKLQDGKMTPIRIFDAMQVQDSYDTLENKQKGDISAIAIFELSRNLQPEVFNAFQNTEEFKQMKIAAQRNGLHQYKTSGNKFIDDNTVVSSVPFVGNSRTASSVINVLSGHPEIPAVYAGAKYAINNYRNFDTKKTIENVTMSPAGRAVKEYLLEPAGKAVKEEFNRR